MPGIHLKYSSKKFTPFLVFFLPLAKCLSLVCARQIRLCQNRKFADGSSSSKDGRILNKHFDKKYEFPLCPRELHNCLPISQDHPLGQALLVLYGETVACQPFTGFTTWPCSVVRLGNMSRLANFFRESHWSRHAFRACCRSVDAASRRRVQRDVKGAAHAQSDAAPVDPHWDTTRDLTQHCHWCNTTPSGLLWSSTTHCPLTCTGLRRVTHPV